MTSRKRQAERRKSTVVDPQLSDLLRNIDHGKTLLRFVKGGRVFSQGDPAEAIYFIQTGKVKVTAVSVVGKEAILAILGPNAFVGEGCLIGHTRRAHTATAIESSTLFRIDNRAMHTALQNQPKLSDKFIKALLARYVDLEADLCDQLFNHSEKRLARLLLKLTRLGHDDRVVTS